MYTGTVLKKRLPWDFYLPFQDVFVHILDKLQDANEFLEKPTIFSSVIEELRNKQRLLEASDVDKVRTFTKPHHWQVGDLAQTNAFHKTLFSQLTVLETVTIPQIKHNFLFSR